MRKAVIVLVAFVLIVACNNAGQKKMNNSSSVKTGKADHIVIPEDLQPTKEQVKERLNNAKINIRIFAKKYGWEGFSTEIYYDSVMVFSDKSQFDKTINKLSGQNKKYAASDCIVLVARTLLLMSPDYVAEYSSFSSESKHFEKYITYVLAKALYSSIFFGEDSNIGPQWFLEGFALFAANLFLSDDVVVEKQTLINTIKNPGSGQLKNYSALVKYLSTEGELIGFVEIASEKHFNDSLIAFVEQSFELKEAE
jgi:hypothetical protein